MEQPNNPLALESFPQNFIKSFRETYDSRSSAFIQKRNEFDLKYSVSDTLELVQQDLGPAMVESLAIPPQSSSSFDFFQSIFVHLARMYESREVQGLPEVWKSLIHKISIQQRSTITEEGSELFASKNMDSTLIAGQENQEEQRNDNRANPTLPDDSTVDMPPSPRTPHEPYKLGFAIFAAIIELVSTLSNFALNDSPKAKDRIPLIYIVLFSSSVAFLRSSTSLLLHDKRPRTANKMQKVAFLFGAFGFLGIVGIHFPPTFMWWFTIPAFLACLLLFTIAIFIKKEHPNVSC